MKKTEFFTVYSAYGCFGEPEEKIFKIKNPELFSEFCETYASINGYSIHACQSCEDEVEVLKEHIKEQKKELSVLIENVENKKASVYDLAYAEKYEERIKKLEELLKKYKED